MDEHTTFAVLRKRVSDFRDERDWLKDNTPKNLAISITVEAAELLDYFQWKTDDQFGKRSTTKLRITKSLTSLLTS